MLNLGWGGVFPVATDPQLAEPAHRVLPETLAGGLEIMAARTLGNPDDVRDAVQETLARTIEANRHGRIPEAVSVGAFAYGIARHVMADALRRRKRDSSHLADVDTLRAPDLSALDQLIQFEERDTVRRALNRLSADDRGILERCFVHGERVVDIATALGEPPERVRKRKSRALEHLRAIMRQNSPGHVMAADPTSQA